MQKKARITTKGQITVPQEICRVLGVRPGDRLIFEDDGKVIRVRPMRTKSLFAKYRGIGNPGMPSGLKAVIRSVRQVRGS